MLRQRYGPIIVNHPTVAWYLTLLYKTSKCALSLQGQHSTLKDEICPRPNKNLPLNEEFIQYSGHNFYVIQLSNSTDLWNTDSYYNKVQCYKRSTLMIKSKNVSMSLNSNLYLISFATNLITILFRLIHVSSAYSALPQYKS